MSLLDIYAEARFGKQAADEKPKQDAEAKKPQVKMTPQLRKIRNALESSGRQEKTYRSEAALEAERARKLYSGVDMGSWAGKLKDITRAVMPGASYSGEGTFLDPGAHAMAATAGAGLGVLGARGSIPIPQLQSLLVRRAMSGIPAKELADALRTAGLPTNLTARSNISEALSRLSGGRGKAIRHLISQSSRSRLPAAGGIIGGLVGSLPFLVANFMRNRQVRATGGPEALEARQAAREYLQRAAMQRRWRAAQLKALGLPEEQLQRFRESVSEPTPATPAAERAAGPRLVPFAPFAQHQQVDVGELTA